jgi:hypothetical protein
MLSTKTKAKAGAKGTWMLVKHPTLRRATVGAAKPTMKLGLKLKSRQRKTEQTAKQRVLPALVIGVAIVAIVLLVLGSARRRKAPDEAVDEPEIPAPSEPETPGPAPATEAPQ